MKLLKRLLAIYRMIKSYNEYVEFVALTLDDVDKLDECIEIQFRDYWEVEYSILEYKGDEAYWLDLKTLSKKINALREALLFDGEI